MRLEIKIRMDNDAFEDNPAGDEAARILRELADHLEGRACLDSVYGRALHDVNGNMVGRAVVFDD